MVADEKFRRMNSKGVPVKGYDGVVELRRIDGTIYWVCGHKSSEVRLFKDAGGALHYKHQCVVCGSSTGGNSISKATAAKIKPLDEIKPWDHTREQLFSSAAEAAISSTSEAESAEWWARYNEYLNSPEWKMRRALVMNRANGICEGCLSRPAEQVHHKTYEHVTEEFMWELVAICEPCHERIHPHDDQPTEARG